MQTTLVSKPHTVKRIGLTILAFVGASFVVQALSHFAVNAEHYAGISFMRAEPIMPLGLFVMVMQGAILAFLFPLLQWKGSVMRRALAFSLLMGLFLGAYIALVEPAKYTVPSVGEWITVEAPASLLQFLLFGVFLGLIHRNADS